MCAMFRWFVVPCIVLAVAACFTWTQWFDDGWVVTAFSAIALLVLVLWRRATYRLVPSWRTLNPQNLDDYLRRQLRNRFAVTFGVSLLTMVVALLCVIFLPAARTTSGFVMAFAVMVWASIVKFGVLNVLAHNVLEHLSPNTDFPQGPLRGSPSPYCKWQRKS